MAVHKKDRSAQIREIARLKAQVTAGGGTVKGYVVSHETLKWLIDVHDRVPGFLMEFGIDVQKLADILKEASEKLREG